MVYASSGQARRIVWHGLIGAAWQWLLLRSRGRVDHIGVLTSAEDLVQLTNPCLRHGARSSGCVQNEVICLKRAVDQCEDMLAALLCYGLPCCRLSRDRPGESPVSGVEAFNGVRINCSGTAHFAYCCSHMRLVMRTPRGVEEFDEGIDEAQRDIGHRPFSEAGEGLVDAGLRGGAHHIRKRRQQCVITRARAGPDKQCHALWVSVEAFLPADERTADLLLAGRSPLANPRLTGGEEGRGTAPDPRRTHDRGSRHRP